jgi:adenine-specific DNA-methyltransferase
MYLHLLLDGVFMPKAVYIDPPYNTGSAFEHYDDGIEHSIWLGLMRDRLELLKKLLSKDGFIFAQIDNNECFYLKMLMDEVFGRKDFINDIIWKRKGGSVNPRNKLNNMTDYILWYAKSQEAQINPVYTIDDEDTQKYIRERFNNIDENGRRYQASPIISPSSSPTLIYEYKGYASPTNGWSLSREKMQEFDREGRLYFPDDKSKRIRRKQFLDEYKGQPIGNLWTDISVINSMSGERLDFVG